MVSSQAFVHPAHMAKPPTHFLRNWRKHRELTLEEVADRIANLALDRALRDPEARGMTMTHATLSRIERGLIPYNETLMELLAEIYQTDVPSLVGRDPAKKEAIWTIWEQLPPKERDRWVAIGETLKRTGTDE